MGATSPIKTTKCAWLRACCSIKSATGTSAYSNIGNHIGRDMGGLGCAHQGARGEGTQARPISNA